MFNDIIDLFGNEGVKWNNSQIEVGQKTVRVLRDALWHITTAHGCFSEAACSIPEKFARFSGYNDWQRLRHKKPTISTEKLDEICESLVNIVDIPANNTTQNKVLISLIEPFIDSLRKFSLRLKKDSADHREKYHRRTEVPRIPEQDCSSEIGVGVGKVEDRYKAFGPNGLGSRSL